MRVQSAIVRPWIKAGLSVLLLESPQRVNQLRSVEPETAQKSEPPYGRKEQSPRQTQVPFGREFPDRKDAARLSSQTPSAVSERSARSGSVRTSARVPDLVQQNVSAAPSSDPARAGFPSSESGLLATPGARPVEAWPASWLALKNRRPLPPRPLVLWTYAGLGEDLTGRPDDVRRQVIVRMLMELHHPGGTHVFWPCGLAGEKPEDGPALFWSGVKFLNPRVLLLFGSDARDTLSMPKTLLPFCQDRVYGRLVIQLPRPQALAGDEASFKRALAFLSRLLRFCARPRT